MTWRKGGNEAHRRNIPVSAGLQEETYMPLYGRTLEAKALAKPYSRSAHADRHRGYPK